MRRCWLEAETSVVTAIVALYGMGALFCSVALVFTKKQMHIVFHKHSTKRSRRDTTDMRILHTADWHLGQTLNGWSRHAEHEIWLDRLADLIAAQEIDVLLVAGDVFDGINPSGEAQRIFYDAMRAFKKNRPHLKIIITSGNHDPSGRLEAPSAILEGLDVHVYATVRTDGARVCYDEHMIPLQDANGDTEAWVCAIPFLRAADLPGLSLAPQEGRGSPVVDAARAFHANMAAAAAAVAGDLPVIAMGHLHCHGATESEGAENRILIGGEHALPEDVFTDVFDYVALGHLHRPQSINSRIRYSGSCFPLSASEINHKHGVTLVEIIDGKIVRQDHIEIERPVAFLRLPAEGVIAIGDLEAAIEALGDTENDDGLHPYLYVNLEADGPASVILTEAERIISRYHVRTASLRVRREVVADEDLEPVISLSETSPEELFFKAFEKVNGMAPEARHLAAFRDALAGE